MIKKSSQTFPISIIFIFSENKNSFIPLFTAFLNSLYHFWPAIFTIVEKKEIIF